MCFETTKSARAKIAKKDIVCWKMTFSDGRAFWQESFLYYRGVKTPIIKIRKDNSYKSIINEGYHSWKNRESANDSFHFWVDDNTYNFTSLTVSQFIIPAGTRYYENETEYVSETIIML